MLQYSLPEVLDFFASARNCNAAVKTFLKREIRQNPEAERFLKGFREAAQKKQPIALANFLKGYTSAQHQSGVFSPLVEIWLLSLARYAQPELVVSISEKVIDRFADEFNTSYQTGSEAITIQDAQKFERIVREAHALVRQLLEEQNVAPSGFTVNVMLASIFEPLVLKEAWKVLEGNQAELHA
jgi:hypothetical protein